MPGEDQTEKRLGAPPKVVADEQLAAQLLNDLVDAHAAIASSTSRRRELALRLNDLGVIQAHIGAALGVSAVAVSNWIRTAREERDGPSDG